MRVRKTWSQKGPGFLTLIYQNLGSFDNLDVLDFDRKMLVIFLLHAPLSLVQEVMFMLETDAAIVQLTHPSRSYSKRWSKARLSMSSNV